jgi:aromatic ring-opening dioxygenase LigB subunit
MSVTVTGMASSHAYTFSDPAEWEQRRKRTRARYAAKYGAEPPEAAGIANETLEANIERFAEIGGGLERLKREFEAFQPDALIVIGDDQDEHYTENIPQFAIYTGEGFVSVDHDTRAAEPATYRNHVELARHLYKDCVESGFDLVGTEKFPEDSLISHAHAQIVTHLKPSVPVIPIFVNAIHVPAPSPARCYAFGEALRNALARFPGSLRVAVYASGGLSHFSAGFPYPNYSGPLGLGQIAEDFDRQLVDWMREGANENLGTLTSNQLLNNGDIELRQWIILMGLLGNRKPDWLVYDAFYRGIMGMAVAYWPPFECHR